MVGDSWVSKVQERFKVDRQTAEQIVAKSAKRVNSQRTLSAEVEYARRTSYGDWLATETSDPEMHWDYSWIQYMLPYIQAVADGDLRWLILNVPPRTGKTSLLTIRFPVYWMERNPHDGIILGSYGGGLATEFAQASLRIYKLRNPTKVSSESQERWTNIFGGFEYPIGVGGGVTGRGAQLIIIDDPIKPLPTDTPVPTPSGWKTMGDLEIGDSVFDHAGKICKVIGKTKRFLGPRWRITFSDRSTIDTHPSHPWRAFSRSDHAVYTHSRKDYGENWWQWSSKREAKVRTVTVKEISESLVARETMRNWTIPNALPLEIPEVALPIDPYILGYWLGDGTAGSAYFTVHKDDLDSLKHRVSDAGYHVRGCSLKCDSETTYVVSVSTRDGQPSKWRDSLVKRLRDLGVLNNKHVPQAYLWASVSQRLSLLRGLMDSDGTLTKGEAETVFGNGNLQIAQSVQYLFSSLGAKASFSEHISASGKPAYQVRAYPTFNPFILPRKSSSFLEGGQIRRRNRTIVSVEDTMQTCDHVCITVDSESHLFLAGRQMVPTHNSYAEANSKAYMDLVWYWFLNDLRTRRNSENTPIVIIHTRWSDADLTGRLMNSSESKLWTRITIPALALTQDERDEIARKYGYPQGDPDPLGRDPGEAIIPDRFSKEFLLSAQETDRAGFASLYQQYPIQLSLASFKVENFVIIDQAPVSMHRVRYWDSAATPGKGDWTVGVLMGITDEGRIVVENVVRGQWGEEDVEKIIKQTAILDAMRYGHLRGQSRTVIEDILKTIDMGQDGKGQWKEVDPSDVEENRENDEGLPGVMQIWLEQEPASSGKQVVNYRKRFVLSGFDVHSETARNSKGVRARPWAACVNAGNADLVYGEWNHAYIQEHRTYVIGVSNQLDDQVDPSSGAYMKLTVDRLRVTMA